MKNVIVTYLSSYGHTKRYAEYIASKLNCEIVEINGSKLSDFKTYDIIVYCAPIRNNIIMDAYKFTYNVDLLKDGSKIFIFADGILKPSRELLESIVYENFYKEDLGRIKFFYGEGGLDIENLKWSDELYLKYYIEEGAKREPGDKLFELSQLARESFDHSDMAYADLLIVKVLEELDK